MMRLTTLLFLAASLVVAPAVASAKSKKAKPTPTATPAPAATVEAAATPAPTPAGTPEEGWEEHPGDVPPSASVETPITPEGAPQRATVSAPKVEVHAQPSVKSNVAATVIQGTFFEALAQSPDKQWVQVRVT